MTRRLTRVAIVAALSAPFTTSAGAHLRHSRAATPESTPAPRADPARPALGFYPEAIDGGVTGNLPFNNQIRKFSDPLNANGGR